MVTLWINCESGHQQCYLSKELTCRLSLFHSLYGARTEVGSSSDQSTNHSGETTVCCISSFCQPVLKTFYFYDPKHFDVEEGDMRKFYYICSYNLNLNCRKNPKSSVSWSCPGSKPAASPGLWFCPAATPTKGTTNRWKGNNNNDILHVISFPLQLKPNRNCTCVRCSTPLRYLVTPSLLKVSADALKELGWMEMEQLPAFPGLTDATAESRLSIPGGGITKALYTDR